LQWYARWRNHRKLHLATKPTVMIFMIAWFWQCTSFRGFTFWFGLALIFSLLGDVFLMCPPSFFMAGLFSFLLGHICYIIGFNLTTLAGDIGLWITGALIGIFMINMLRYYLAALKNRLVSKRVRAGVVTYILTIHVMIFSALTTFWQPEWAFVNALLVSTGALLFGISDSMLAYERFIKRIPNAHVWIMMTYHLAQVFIISGAIKQYLWIS
jgi:uncharacterized membrane protein YhhN